MNVQVGIWAIFLAGFASSACAGERQFVDLSPHFNFKLSENLGRGLEGNNLKQLPTGIRTFGDSPGSSTFNVGDGVVQLGSKVLTEQPERIEGIKVGKKTQQIHFLHATGFGGGPCDDPAHPYYVAKGTQIGEYVVTYEDGGTEGIPIVYGEDVRDWFFHENEPGVERGKIVWTGDNDFAKGVNARLRLYSGVWKNPYPDKVIKSIDFIGRKTETVAAPFCLAITLETP
jgi:hypothetical protein